MAQGDYAWRNKWIVNRTVRSEGEKIHLSTVYTHTMHFQSHIISCIIIIIVIIIYHGQGSIVLYTFQTMPCVSFFSCMSQTYSRLEVRLYIYIYYEFIYIIQYTHTPGTPNYPPNHVTLQREEEEKVVKLYDS